MMSNNHKDKAFNTFFTVSSTNLVLTDYNRVLFRSKKHLNKALKDLQGKLKYIIQHKMREILYNWYCAKKHTSSTVICGMIDPLPRRLRAVDQIKAVAKCAYVCLT